MCLRIFMSMLFIASASAASGRDIKKACPPMLAERVGNFYLQVNNGTCFYFPVNKKATYTQAKDDCAEYGGNLTMPKSRSLNDFLTSQLAFEYKVTNDIWIGLHDKKDESHFVWDDGTQMKWSNFADGNGLDNNWIVSQFQDCVALDPMHLGQWYDCQCEGNIFMLSGPVQKMYVCEYPREGREAENFNANSDANFKDFKAKANSNFKDWKQKVGN